MMKKLKKRMMMKKIKIRMMKKKKRKRKVIVNIIKSFYFAHTGI